MEPQWPTLIGELGVELLQVPSGPPGCSIHQPWITDFGAPAEGDCKPNALLEEPVPTEPRIMTISKEPGTQPIPGYHLIERLGTGGFGEVWKCEVSGGLLKAIKFVHGNGPDQRSGRKQADEELAAIQNIKAIRHPYLLSIERVELVDEELLIVTELADRNLYELFSEHHKANRSGIPRDQLLSYLLEAAEVLDVLNFSHNLQHLDIKPQNLFLVGNHVKVGDFGLVTKLPPPWWETPTTQSPAVSPLYGSPERFQGTVHRNSDQYSLAIVYLQMLTGCLPFDGESFQHCMMLHLGSEPKLKSLPVNDQGVVGRALSKDPSARFPTCRAFIQALLESARATDPKTAPTWISPTARAHSQNQGGEAHPSGDSEIIDVADELKRGQEVISNTRPVEHRISNGLFDEWKAIGPDNNPRLLRRIYGLSMAPSSRRRRVIKQLLALRSEWLSPLTISEDPLGHVLCSSPLASPTLADRLEECRSQRLSGIPRRELLKLLSRIAAILDNLASETRLFHLRLHPSLVALEDQNLRLDQFGLAQLIWLPSGYAPHKVGGEYSAPELANGSFSSASDQYSLALMFCHLVTGGFPKRLQNSASAPPGSQCPWDLASFAPEDATILDRALSNNPMLRWPSSTAFVDELSRSRADQSAGGCGGDEFSDLVLQASLLPRPNHLQTPAEAVDILKTILTLAWEEDGIEGPPTCEPCPLYSRSRNVLSYQFNLGMSVGEARLKMDVIRRLWQGEPWKESNGKYLFIIRLPGLSPHRAHQPSRRLVVGIHLERHHACSEEGLKISIRIKPRGSGKKRGARMLETIGPSVLEQLQSALRNGSRKRSDKRVRWPHPIQIQPVYTDGSAGEWSTCRGIDLSVGGVGFYLPHPLPTVDVIIRLPAVTGTPSAELPASIVRARRETDGWYQAGAAFCLAEPKLTSQNMSLTPVEPGTTSDALVDTDIPSEMLELADLRISDEPSH